MSSLLVGIRAGRGATAQRVNRAARSLECDYQQHGGGQRARVHTIAQVWRKNASGYFPSDLGRQPYPLALFV
jgi:hypothetical protein